MSHLFATLDRAQARVKQSLRALILHRLRSYLKIGAENLEQIVKVVRHSSCQLAQRLQPVLFDECAFRLFAARSLVLENGCCLDLPLGSASSHPCDRK